jgi:predicted metal-dependent phosphotriesterase family hydrolase
MRTVQTVLGPVSPHTLGRVLTHEHLLSLLPGPWLTGGTDDATADIAVRALGPIRAYGFGTVVDQTPYGVLGRSVESRRADVLQEIAERTGLNVITGSAIYLEPYGPDWARRATLDQMTERFIADAEARSDGLTVAAGIYGEQATSLGKITHHEEKCLRAVARAHRESGLAISTHTTHGTMGIEQIAILSEEGADLDRVVIGHMDIQPDPSYVGNVLASGVSVAFDTIGKQSWDFVLEPTTSSRPDGEFAKRSYFRSDHGRAQLIAELVKEGYSSKILLAHDLTGAELHLNPSTHGTYGYAYLGEIFLPMLRSEGVSEAAIDQMLVGNPARLLSVA